MNRWKEFFTKIGYGLNPFKYVRLVELFMKDLLKQFAMFLAFAMIIGLALSIPALLSLPDNLETKLDGFETFTVDLDANTSKPVTFDTGFSFLTVDTDSDGNMSDSMFLITGDSILVDAPFKEGSFALTDYEDLLSNKEGLGKLLAWMFFMMLPSILLMLFVFFAMKYLLIALGAAVIAKLIVKMTEFKIGFPNIYKVGMAAVTPLVLIDMVRIPFSVQTYGLQYAVFAIFFIMGVIKVGDFEPGDSGGSSSKDARSKKTKNTDDDGYIEIKNKVF